MAISPNILDRDKAAYKENTVDSGLDRRVTDVTSQDILTNIHDAIIDENDETQNILQTEFDQTQSLLTAEFDETQAKQDTGNATLASIDGKIDVNLSTRASEITLDSVLTQVTAINANTDTLEVKIGDLTETAPVSDTASSGLNGRLQRIAQRLTSLITAVTDKTQWTKITDGTTDASIKASSTPAALTDTAIVFTPRPYNYTNITNAATTVVKSGAGVLHTIVINTVANSTVTVYDNTAASGTIIALINTINGVTPISLLYDIRFNTGLTIVTSSATPDFTITWL